MSTSCVEAGQFADADASTAAYEAEEIDTESPEAEASGESGEEEEEDGWELEYEDWQSETTDFTKKLNAVRSGHASANLQRGKSDTQGPPAVTQKAIQVLPLYYGCDNLSLDFPTPLTAI